MIEINNQTSFRLDKKKLSTVAKKVIKGENKEIENLSIAFVGSADIKKLNKKYRHKNKPTDVLSFEGDKKIDYSLGEVIICPEIVKENAEKFKTRFENELVKILIHGILHLCGYDHEKSEKEAVEMEKKEEQYILKVSK
jgi:probable rRNA maturation factor